MNATEYKIELQVIRTLTSSLRTKLHKDWDEVVETKDLHSKEGELYLKLVGGVSNKIYNFKEEAHSLEELVVDMEMIEGLVEKLDDNHSEPRG